MKKIEDILSHSRVIPVLTIEDIDDALPLSGALIDGGLPVLEVTLRTRSALSAVELIANSYANAWVGVGTLLDPLDIKRAKDAGASFAVSPGMNLDLIEQASHDCLAYLPGIQTSSEAMTAYRAGIKFLKFFPAKAAGGTHALQQLGPVYPELMFCPTGGIGFSDAPDFLQLQNVTCIGGSFASPPNLVKAKNWDAIVELARRAAQL